MSEDKEVIDDKKIEDTPTPGAKQEPSVEELNERLKKLEEEKAELEREKKGIYGDLKSEQERRRELESRIQATEKKIEASEDMLEKISDDEFITARQLKDLRNQEMEKSRKMMLASNELRARERMSEDEARMMERTEENPSKYPVSYQEAIAEFESLAKKDPSLWDEVDRAKYRPGGKPAEVAYKIALRDSPKYRDIDRKKTREEILQEMEKQERRPKHLSAGGGRGSRTLENMSETEILEMSDAELEKALRGNN